jgi:hypothetical protein
MLFTLSFDPLAHKIHTYTLNPRIESLYFYYRYIPKITLKNITLKVHVSMSLFYIANFSTEPIFQIIFPTTL